MARSTCFSTYFTHPKSINNERAHLHFRFRLNSVGNGTDLPANEWRNNIQLIVVRRLVSKVVDREPDSFLARFIGSFECHARTTNEFVHFCLFFWEERNIFSLRLAVGSFHWNCLTVCLCVCCAPIARQVRMMFDTNRTRNKIEEIDAINIWRANGTCGAWMISFCLTLRSCCECTRLLGSVFSLSPFYGPRVICITTNTGFFGSMMIHLTDGRERRGTISISIMVSVNAPRSGMNFVFSLDSILIWHAPHAWPFHRTRFISIDSTCSSYKI